MTITAGSRSDLSAYAEKLQHFDWDEFYDVFEGKLYFKWMHKQLLQNADIVLIDSRTGITEMGGVCTRDLADVVVALCAPNFDNLDSIIMMASSFTHPDVEEYKGRPLKIIIVPSRVDNSEVELRNDFINLFKQKVSKFVPKIFQKVRTDFLKLIIEYVPRYSYLVELAISGPEREGFKPLEENYKELAIHMGLLAPRRSSLYQKLARWINYRFPLPRIFVSCEPSDGSEIAEELCNKFEQRAFTIWQDIDMHEKDEQQQISELINKVEYVLLVLTPDALHSKKAHRKWWFISQ